MDNTNDKVTTTTETPTVENGAKVEAPTQEQIDNVVKERLARAEAKHAKELAEAVKRATEEATRLASMDAETRAKELAQKQLSDLKEREQRLTLKENTAVAKDLLSEQGIPTKFAEQLVTLDEEQTKARVDTFIKEWNEAINAGVQKQVAGVTPKDLITESKQPTTKAVTSF